MSKTNTDKIKSLFEKALDIDKSKRESFFENLDDSEKQYAEEVKSLLESYEEGVDFLEIETENSNFAKNSTSLHPLIGKHIGPYLIEEEIGIGGMGVVFAGKRDDGEFYQKVAVKIIKQGLSSDYLLKRFQNERQTLANLQHPNIAKLFDGGKTSEELPYLIMEFIEGIPITEYCDKNNLSVENRLKLFVTVCKAVQYAHQNLVVHRDIKPGNILVNKEGNPKLLDFGVAKLLSGEYTEESDEALTKPGMWHLTPEYASPEQINGSNITTSSDIYSLGVLLYKLLTGSEPYKIYNNSPLVISKIIAEEKITRPSEVLHKQTKESAADNGELRKTHNPVGDYKQLKGDLDNIVLKAMHKEPSQRYSSVQEFANDIERYLSGLPVIARSDTITYRFTKFVKRHKAGVALFILINLIVVVSVAAIIYQGAVAAKERDKAKVENQKYEKVNDFLTNILSSVAPNEIGRDVKVYDILEKAAEDVENDFKGQPEIEASIKSTLGNTYVNLGEYEKGKPFLMQAYEINKKIYGEHSKETAESIHDLGLYYDWIGEYHIADSLYGKSIDIFNEVLTEPTKIYAEALNNHAIVKMNFGENDEAQKLYLKAIEISKSVEGEKNRNVAVMMNNLAISYMDTGKLDEAEQYYKKSLKIIMELLGKERPEVGSAYNNMAKIFIKKEQFDSAEIYLQKSYELKYKLKGKDHPDVGLALNNLGVLEIHRKNYDKAEQYFTRGLKQYLETYSEEHPLVWLSNYWLGRVYFNKREYSLSESYYRKSLGIMIKKMPEDYWEIWRTKGELGICLVKLDKLSEAENLLNDSYNYYIKNLPDNKLAIQDILTGIVDLYEKLNDQEKLSKFKNLLESYKKST